MKYIYTYLCSNKPIAWCLAILWTLGIFIGCSRPGKDLPKLHLFENFDKLVHFIFFFVFAYLWQIVFNKKNKSIIYAIIVAVLYGIGIEFYQKYCVASRSFDVWDIVADAIGAIAVLFIIPKKSVVY